MRGPTLDGEQKRVQLKLTNYRKITPQSSPLPHTWAFMIGL